MKIKIFKEVFVLTLLVIIFGAMFLTIKEMPKFGDPNSPANNVVSDRFKQDHIEDTNSPNVVTAIITDYRAFDTLGETTVLFTAICAAVSVLKK